MNNHEIIEIIQACINGEKIEEKHPRFDDIWRPFDGSWKFSITDYRIAPSKPLECWINKYKGLKPYAHTTKKDALDHTKLNNLTVVYTAVHMKEVMPEDEWQTGCNPKENGIYLVSIQLKNGDDIHTAFHHYTDDGWSCNDLWEVVAWKPRPTPWKGESDEQNT